MFRKSLSTFAGGFFLLATIGLAQDNSGRISGTVTDNSGAIVPGAKIVVKDAATQFTYKATTDADGFYVVPNLPVGTYNVEVEASGFRKAERTGYDLTDRGRITADFKLEVGTVTESVVVTAARGETVNTVSGEISRTIDSEQVRNMALNGRNYLELITVLPGVALLDPDQMATTTSLSVSYFSVNGQRSGTSHLSADGGMNLDSGSNTSQVNNVGVDFIREVSVATSAFSAQYGRNSGAAINVVTKSGTDQFHGSAHEFFRNDYLDAKDYFAPVRPKLRFNNFGWTLGGPIAFGGLKKGKLYFFAGQDYKRIRRLTNPTRRTLPTRAERLGDFTDRTTTTIRNPGTQTPVASKNLSALMTPDGRAIMKVYDAMEKFAVSYVDTPTSNNATFQVLNPFDFREDIIRVDYRISDRQNLYARWIHDNYNTIDPFGTFNGSDLPTTPTLRNRPGYGPQIGHTLTITPTIINEMKLVSSWNGQRTPLQGDKWDRATYGFQFPRIFGGNGLYSTGIPDVSINSFASFNGPARVYLASPTTDISFSDNLTFLWGKHHFQTGVMIVRNRKDQNGRSIYDGSVNFNASGNSGTTNFALADAALGLFRTYQEAQSDPLGFYRFWQTGLYIQDSWKISSNLSLEIGYRHEFFTPTYAQANNIANFDPALYDPAKAVKLTTAGLIVPGSGNPFNGIVRAGDGVPAEEVGRVPGATSAATLAVPAGAPRGLYPSYNLHMPRFGFSYSPFKDRKTAIRGGFGVYHDRVQGNLIFSQSLLPPYSGSVSYENANLANPTGGSASAP
ncbi:MAG TPA: carboxypeptidase regulatory-like domain-containing protein, partial [Bryobacteraceae bacterium]|nr:carboxypeptidase regulatory-like domain-containing protein [Bryobacteraceae bacterium]